MRPSLGDWASEESGCNSVGTVKTMWKYKKRRAQTIWLKDDQDSVAA